MSTNANISIVNLDNSIECIYLHSDGYLSWAGVRLLRSYNTETKVRELITLGNISSLGDHIGEKHNFDDFNFGFKREWCRVYARDRNEGWSDVKPRTYQSVQTWKRQRAEYNYMFRENEWYIADGNSNPINWKLLAIEVVTDRITS